MSKVYVPQQPSRFDSSTQLWIPVIDIRSAAKYGELVVIFDQRSSRAKLPEIVASMRSKLADYGENDYLLALGDPAMIVAATLIISEKTGGKVNLLKWDRNERDYYLAEIDAS